jgi:hypothetical protein
MLARCPALARGLIKMPNFAGSSGFIRKLTTIIVVTGIQVSDPDYLVVAICNAMAGLPTTGAAGRL